MFFTLAVLSLFAFNALGYPIVVLMLAYLAKEAGVQYFSPDTVNRYFRDHMFPTWKHRMGQFIRDNATRIHLTTDIWTNGMFLFSKRGDRNNR